MRNGRPRPSNCNGFPWASVNVAQTMAPDSVTAMLLEPWISTFRGRGSYTVPRIDVLVSTTIRSTVTNASGDVASSGSSLDANYQMPNTVVQQLLGRLPAGALGSGTTTVNLLTPSALYPLKRRTQIDMRFAKILRFGRARYDIGVDLYNLLNSNAATGYEETFVYATVGATWLNPTSIMAPRLARFNVTTTF